MERYKITAVVTSLTNTKLSLQFKMKEKLRQKFTMYNVREIYFYSRLVSIQKTKIDPNYTKEWYVVATCQT